MAYEQYTNGIPYLGPGSLLSDVPYYTQALAPKLVNSRGETLSTVSDLVDDHETRLNNVTISRFVGRYHHNFGNIPAGGDRTYNLTGFAFNGEAGDVWSVTFSAATGPMSGYTTAPGKIRLSTASGVAFWSSAMATTFIAREDEPSYATYSWRAPAANDYLVVTCYGIATMVPALWVAADVINHGNI